MSLSVDSAGTLSSLGRICTGLLLGLGGLSPVLGASLDIAHTNPECSDERGAPYCTLQAAIRAAEKDPEPDTLVLVGGGVYTLTESDHRKEGGNGLPPITTPITVEGNGGTVERSDALGTEEFRIFRIEPTGRLHLRDLTIRGGSTAHGFDGAGLWNRGELTLERCRVTRNRSLDDGGGIRNDGYLTLLETTVDHNASQGIGGVGGGLYNVGMQGDGVARIERSAFLGNVAEVSGGAVWNETELTAVNSTFSGNRAKDHAGGIQNHGSAWLNNCTVADNRAGLSAGGVRGYLPIRVSNTIIAGNVAPVGRSCQGTLRSLGHNLISTPERCTLEDFGDSDLLGTDPELEVLSDNGGSTFTHALNPTSPAVDAGAMGREPGEPGACEAVDQRGMGRTSPAGATVPARCDIGAFEVNPPEAP